jgi:LPS-assembly protein
MSFVRVLRRLLPLAFVPVLLGAAPAPQIAIPGAAPDIQGENSTYDDATKQLVVTGNARLTYGDTFLTADEIRFNFATQEAGAKGNVNITSGQRRLVADEGTYNTGTGIITARNLRVGQFPIYISGETVNGTFDELVFTNATVFFRENAQYTPSIRASRLTYHKGKVVRAEGLAIGLLGGHILRLPKFEQALDSEFFSYVTAHLGYRANLGAFVEAGLHLPVAPDVKVGADVGLYTKRGVMVGPSGRYRRSDGENSIDGLLRSGYIHDTGDRGTDFLGKAVPADRGYVTWRHRQRSGEHLTLDGEYNYWSDSEILRDFRHRDFDNVQQPDSFLEGAYAQDEYMLSAFFRFHPNQYHRVQERLPELRFDLVPEPLALGAYQRLNVSAALLESDSYGVDPKLKTTRYDAYYGLERPIAPTPWLTFTPVAGGRYTYYSDARGGKDDYKRAIGEIGFDARLLAAGVFEYKNEVWEIDGLRHLVEPRLSYRYAPEAGRGRAYIPPIDARVFSTYLQPLSIADSRNVDTLTALNTARIGFNNTLQTRDKEYGSRNLATLNFAADYQFDPAPGRHSLSDLYTELALTPAPWLRWEIFHRMDLHEGAQQELNTGLTLIDQNWWSVRLATHFLKQDYEEYFLEYRQRINEVYDVTALWRYDATNDRLNEQSYGVWQRLGQTWAVKYEVSFFDGPRRESHFSFAIEVELLKF